MAGRTPREALNNFVRPLQRALSVISEAVILRRAPIVGEIQALTVSDEPLRVRRDFGDPLWLLLAQEYQIVEDDRPELGPWKVSTRAYRYRIDDREDGGRGAQLFSWHWHPHTLPGTHLHAHRSETDRAHLPTGRVSMEAIVRFLIEDLGASPRRPDWDEVLGEAEAAFADWRTWS